MNNNLHAHVSSASADCDGPVYRDYVVGFSEDEIAESLAANGINDFSDIHFMQRTMMNHCSPYAVHQMRITMDEGSVEWHEDTEEGYRAGTILWCRDEDCDPSAASYRDVYAEQMGY